MSMPRPTQRKLLPTLPKRPKPFIAAGLLAFCALLAQPAAHAALGQGLASAAHDGTPVAAPQRLIAKAALAASAAAGAAAAVQSQVVLTPQGATVTEYANAAGTIFAITWRGPFKPDLQQLLGQYFAPFQQGLPRAGLGLTAAVVHGDNIVVHSFGHMRNFYGLAWVPSLLPAGFDVAGLQP
jgi:hypothetical protein